MHSSPTGWSIPTIADVADIGPKKAQLDSSPDTEFNFVPMPAVKEEFGGIDVATLRPYSEVKKGYTQFQEGDVLFAKITPCMENGKIAVVPKLDNTVGYGSTEFHVLRPADSLSPKWLAYYLSQTGFRRDAQRSMTGSAGQLRVSKRWLSEQTIPVPPIPTQDEILAKIEELFSDLDAGVAALERARANLKRYRASVLKAAVEGKLTEQWRAEHRDVEPASALLERILAERRKKWEEEQLRKYEAKGKKPPKGWREKYREPFHPDAEGLPTLPDTWCWASIDEISYYLRNGLSKKPVAEPSGIPILRINAVRPMLVDLNEVRYYTDKSVALDDYLLDNGDLLFTRYNGSVELLGVAGLVRGCDMQLLHPDKLMRLKTVVQSPFPEYVEIAANVGASRSHMVGRARTTAGQTGVSGGDVREMPIPLSPLTEQGTIVSLVEEAVSIIRALEEVLAASEVRASRLRQAILKRAFEGKLVGEGQTRTRPNHADPTVESNNSLELIHGAT